MPRQIEVWDRDMWVKWGGPTLPGQQWRYVGGVLEYQCSDGGWQPSPAQRLTIEDARARCPEGTFRLRPYDDAEDIVTVYARELPGLIQAERPKQHAGRHAFADMADEMARAGPQRPADASVASTGDPWPVDWRALYGHATRLSNELSDQCGALRTELDEAYAKIGRLTREVERLGRKKR